MKKVVLWALLITFLYQCTSEKKESETEVAENAGLVMNIYLQTNENFKSSVYWKEETQPKYSQDLMMSQIVYKNPEFQDLMFDFEGSIPNSIRIDLGNNTNLKELLIEKIEFQFKDRNFTVGTEDIFKYFKKNKYIKYDPKTFIFDILTLDGVTKPQLIANETLDSTLKTLMRTKPTS